MDWITGISKAIDYIEEHITAKPTIWAQQPARAAPPARPVSPRAAHIAAELIGRVSAIRGDDTTALPFSRWPRRRQTTSLFRTDGNQMDIIPSEQILYLRINLRLTIVTAILAEQAGAD